MMIAHAHHAQQEPPHKDHLASETYHLKPAQSLWWVTLSLTHPTPSDT